MRTNRGSASPPRFRDAQTLGRSKALCNGHLARAALERQPPPRTCGDSSRTATRLLVRRCLFFARLSRLDGLGRDAKGKRLPKESIAMPPRRGRPRIDRPRGRPYDGRPGGLRAGSPPSPPPRSIRPTVRRLPRSPRLSGPGPHRDRPFRPAATDEPAPVGADRQPRPIRRPALAAPRSGRSPETAGKAPPDNSSDSGRPRCCAAGIGHRRRPEPD